MNRSIFATVISEQFGSFGFIPMNSQIERSPFVHGLRIHIGVVGDEDFAVFLVTGKRRNVQGGLIEFI